VTALLTTATKKLLGICTGSMPPLPEDAARRLQSELRLGAHGPG